MVGFTEPNRYEPRAGWRQTLAQWVQLAPGATSRSWQHQISVYWRWRTLDGLSLREAWEELGMEPATARAALDPQSPDSGRIPPELFSRVLARSRANNIDPDDNVADVNITTTPLTELPDKPEVGFTPASSIRRAPLSISRAPDGRPGCSRLQSTRWAGSPNFTSIGGEGPRRASYRNRLGRS